MGTSISHPSPYNKNWKPVRIGYENPNVSLKTVISQIWRASENQSKPLSTDLSSDTVFRCHEIVKNSKNVNEALKTYSSEVLKSKQNSIVAEFAKRAIPISMNSENPAKAWRSNFFSEVTNYIISRDASGYVGENYRNKSIADLGSFKNSIKQEVGSLINQISMEPTSPKQWNSFVSQAIGVVRKGGMGND